MRYELILAAAAKGDRDADKLIPTNWDALLQTLGRPMRYDLGKLVTQFPDDEHFALDPAPKSIQFVMLQPGKAREAATTAVNNAEVQKLVDADQAIRKRWNSLSEAEHKQASIDDHVRNLRIREIVNSDSTGLEYPLTVVTRNVTDFQRSGVNTLNPFSDRQA